VKKSERHRAKRDELVTVFERLSAYTETHVREVGLVAAGVVIAVLSGLGLASWLQNRNERSSFLLGELIQAYRAPLALSPEAQEAPAGVATPTPGSATTRSSRSPTTSWRATGAPRRRRRRSTTRPWRLRARRSTTMPLRR